MVYINRWATFAACALIQSCAGLGYAWSIVAPALKQRFDFDEEHLNTVGAALSLGSYAAIFAGFVTDAVIGHHKFGPRLVLWVGALVGLVGFSGLYTLATDTSMEKGGLRPPPPMGTIIFFAFLAGNAGSWLDTATLATCVRNFPNDRGTVLGLLKSFLGLSASIFATFYAAVYEPDAISFLLFLAVAPATVVLAASAFVNFVPPEYREAESLLLPPVHHGHPSAVNGFTTPLGYGDATADDDAVWPPLLRPSSVHPSAALPPPPAPHHLRRRLRSGDVCMSKAARFSLCYLLVSTLALYQLASTLYEAEHPPTGGDAAQRVCRGLAALMVALLALLLLIPLYAGGFLPAAADARSPHFHTHVPPAYLSSASHHGHHSYVPPALRESPSKQDHGETDKAGSSLSVPSAVGSETTGRPTSSTSSGRAPHGSLQNDQRQLPLPAAAAVAAAAAAAVPPSVGQDARSSVAAAVGPPPGAPAATFGGAGADADGGDVVSTLGSATEDEAQEEAEACEASTAPPQELTLSQAAQTAAYWLLFLQALVGVGTGLTLLNNLGSIVVALGGKPGGQVAFVSLFAVANAVGRLLFGFVSERHLHLHGTPRTLFLLVASASMLLVALYASQATLGDLYPLSILGGVVFGGFFSLTPSIASDLFGLRHFASIYATLQLAPAAGSVGLASGLAGYLYVAAAEAHGTGRVCVGADCYQRMWYILVVLNATALAGTAMLLHLTRPTYARMLAARRGAQLALPLHAEV